MARKTGRIDPELINSLLKDRDPNRVLEQDALRQRRGRALTICAKAV